MQLGLPFDGTIAPPSVVAIAPVYYVRHRRARRYVLRVDIDGRVRVTIPRGGSRREADAFAQKHAEWVARQRARLPRGGPAVEERRALRERAVRDLPPRLIELAGQHGLTVSRVSVRNQRSRWGSCGRDGHICLNWRLVLMPPWVSDYVLDPRADAPATHGSFTGVLAPGRRRVFGVPRGSPVAPHTRSFVAREHNAPECGIRLKGACRAKFS